MKRTLKHTAVVNGLDQLSEGLAEDYLEIAEGISNGNYASAWERLGVVLSNYDDKETGMFRIQKANLLSLRGDETGARKILQQLLKEPGKEDMAHAELAKLYFREGNLQRAEEERRSVVKPEKALLVDMIILKSDIRHEEEDAEAAAEVLKQGVNQIKNTINDPDVREFFVSCLLSRFLEITADETEDELFGEAVDYVMRYCEDNPIQSENTYLLNSYTELLEKYSGDLYFRSSAWPLLDTMEETGRAEGSEDLLLYLRSVLEINEALEYDQIDPVIYRMLGLDETDTEQRHLTGYEYAKHLKESPEAFQTMEHLYPYLNNYLNVYASWIKEDPERIMQEAKQYFAAARSMSETEAETYLERMYEADMFDMKRWIGYELSVIPEPLRGFAERAEIGYQTDQLEEAADQAEMVLRRMKHPNEKMIYIRLCYAVSVDDLQQAKRDLRAMKKEFPDSVRTRIAEAKVKHAEGKNPAALRILRTLVPSGAEADDLISLYADVISETEAEDDLRSAVLKQLAYMEENPPVYEAERCFRRYAYILTMIADIRTRNEKFLKEDLEHEKEILAEGVLNLIEEDRTAYWITVFCTEAMESEWASKYFIDFIRWCDKNHIFASQDMVIRSAYSSYESYQAYRDEAVNEDLFDFISAAKSDSDSQEPVELAELFWRAAEAVRRDPEAYTYIRDHYPNFAGPVEDDIAMVLEEPEQVKKSSEEFIAELSGMTQEEVRTALNRSVGIYEGSDVPKYN